MCSYSDVRGVDVSSVVLLGGHQLHPGAVVGQDVLEAVLVRALGLLGHQALTRRVPPRDALVLLQQLAALQVLLQELALQREGGVGGGDIFTTANKTRRSGGKDSSEV